MPGSDLNALGKEGGLSQRLNFFRQLIWLLEFKWTTLADYIFFFQTETLSHIEMYLGVAKPILAQNQIDQVLYRFITNTIKIQNEYILSVQPKHTPNSDSKTYVKK